MTELLLNIIIFLPKKWQAKFIKRQWDKKTDDAVMLAFEDATDLIELSKGRFGAAMVSVAETAKVRLEQYIVPQMQERGIDS